MLLYITRKYPPSIGGMQRFNEKLVSHLRRWRDFYLIFWGHSQTFMPLFLFFAFLKAIALRLSKKIDLIYLADGLMSPLGVVLKKILSVPVAVNIHGRDIAFAFPGYLKIIPWALKRVDSVICVSGQLKEECRKFGVPERILRVIPNGVDVADFSWTREVSPRRYLGINLENRTVLLTVGRLVPKKGVDRFIRDILPQVAEQAPDATYLVVGDGPLRPEIEGLIQEKNLEKHVILTGDVPMDDTRLRALYCCADVFVMPNVEVRGDIEGFGIVALEAGAAGLPVVASKLQGIREAISPGENGILIEWDDNQEYVRTLLDLISHPEERKKLGEKARHYVREHYSWEKISRQYSEIFTELARPTV